MRGIGTRSKRSGSGLTLIELVVAVALLAVLAAMAYRGLDSMIRAGERAQAETERWRAISMFFNRFGEDIGHATKRRIRGGDGAPLAAWIGKPVDPASNDGAPPEDKVNAQLEFTRKSVPGNDEMRLGYRLRNKRMELLIWPVLDRAPTSTAEVYPVLDEVKSMRLGYLDRDGVWRDSWPIADSVQIMPRAVAIELTLSDNVAINRVFALP